MTGAAFWAVSALFHTAVFLMSGDSWEGPLSWRKPIVFSVSVGSLMWVMGWVIDRLRTPRPRLAGWVVWTFVISGSIETGLIAMQTWRGEASHFNTAETTDGIIFGLMGGMVGLMSVALVALAVWALVDRPRDPDVRLAVLAGLAMVVAGLGLGQWIIDLGMRYVEQHGAVPSVVRYGEAGVAKFPHAVAFHGIHVFAALAAFTRARRTTERHRIIAMRSAVVAYASLLAFAGFQTYAGLAPFDLGLWSRLVVMGAVGVLVVVFARTAFVTSAGDAGPERGIAVPEPSPLRY